MGAAVVASYPFVTTVAGMSTLEGFLVEVVIELPFVLCYTTYYNLMCSIYLRPYYDLS